VRTLIAADASPLIGLATADAFDLLRRLFGTVTITRAVLDEVMAGGRWPGARELDAAMRDGWIRVAPTPMDTWRFPELGTGEASTIALALQHEGEKRVLMDDTLGRAHATALGLEVTDLAELFVAAKRAGHIVNVRPFFERLARRGFTVPEESLRAALEATGEAMRF
jgi:predicted nucleic acid-binding protein